MKGRIGSSVSEESDDGKVPVSSMEIGSANSEITRG